MRASALLVVLLAAFAAGVQGLPRRGSDVLAEIAVAPRNDDDPKPLPVVLWHGMVSRWPGVSHCVIHH